MNARRNTVDNAASGDAPGDDPPSRDPWGPDARPSNAPVARQSSRFEDHFQGMDRRPSRVTTQPYPELPPAASAANTEPTSLRELFPSLSPARAAVPDLPRITGKSMINQDPDEETGELLKDPVGYAENPYALRARALDCGRGPPRAPDTISAVSHQAENGSVISRHSENCYRRRAENGFAILPRENGYARGMENSQGLSRPVENGHVLSRRATSPHISLADHFENMTLGSDTPPSQRTPFNQTARMPSQQAYPQPIGSNAVGGAPTPRYSYVNQHAPDPNRNMPAANPNDMNPPCNTLYVGNLPPDASEEELKALFSKARGYKRLCFRNKQNGPMCFVEFNDIDMSSKALNEFYGQKLSNSIRTGIRLSFSKNPLGVRPGQPGSSTDPNAASRQHIGHAAMHPPAYSAVSGPPPGLAASPCGRCGQVTAPPYGGPYSGAAANPPLTPNPNGYGGAAGLGISASGHGPNPLRDPNAPRANPPNGANGVHGANGNATNGVNGANGANGIANPHPDSGNGTGSFSYYPDYMMGR